MSALLSSLLVGRDRGAVSGRIHNTLGFVASRCPGAVNNRIAESSQTRTKRIAEITGTDNRDSLLVRGEGAGY